MHAAFFDAFFDSLRMAPLLLLIYMVLEAIEHRYEQEVKALLLRATPIAPLFGAVAGCVPQCGFSVIAAALYTQHVISRGTLLAVFLSTSDEAIPVILAQPGQTGVLLPLIGAKIAIAVAAGYAVDLLPLLGGRRPLQPHAEDCHCLEASHCCGPTHRNAPWWGQFLVGPLRHTAQVTAFVFLVSLLINLVVLTLGEQSLHQLFLPHSLLQPLAAVLLGLIPNCAASVAITQVFLRGGITFGSAVAGLCASAGLGGLVLFKETSVREAAGIIAELAAISFIAGLIVNALG